MNIQMFIIYVYLVRVTFTFSHFICTLLIIFIFFLLIYDCLHAFVFTLFLAFTRFNRVNWSCRLLTLQTSL